MGSTPGGDGKHADRRSFDPPIGPILFIAADVPWPPDGGGRIASLRVLEAFSRIATVDLVALADPFRTLELGHLRSICRRVQIVPHPFTFGLHRTRQSLVALRSLASRSPYRLRKFESRRFVQAIADAKRVTPYVLVHHEQLGVAPYRDASLPATALVQNVESEIYRLGSRAGSPAARLWAGLEATKLRRAEPAALKGFDGVFVLSKDDADLLTAMGVERTSVVPIPAPPVRRHGPPPDRKSILTLGSMSWFGVADGLRWFHELVWPTIRTLVPTATWDLVGPGAPEDVRECTDEPGIVVHGYVDDIEPILAATRVGIVPLRVAGGIRIKLLEFLAGGVPTVATSIGAQGLAFPDGAGCFRRDDPQAFAQSVAELLTNDELWRLTADAGQAHVEVHHGVDALTEAVSAGARAAIDHHAMTKGRRDRVGYGRA